MISIVVANFEFTYDLDLTEVSELTDITMLTIEKQGTDALGIASISLQVNGVEVFDKFFGETASTCLWIDEGDGYFPNYTIFHSELRAHRKWQAYIGSPPQPSPIISNAEVVSRVEGVIGDFLHGKKLYWDEDAFHPVLVAAEKLDDRTLKVDVDLRADVDFIPDPKIDVNFDLRFEFECEVGAETATATLTVKTRNPRINWDAPDWLTLIVPELAVIREVGEVGLLEPPATLLGLITDRIPKNLEDSLQFSFGPFTFRTRGECPTMRVDANGNIIFS